MDTDNPNGSSEYESDYGGEDTGRDVEIDQIRTGTETAYAGAYRIAVETLAATGLSGPDRGTFGMDRDQAHRLVGHVLGAALLELEGPWRDALELAQHHRDSRDRTIDLLEGELTETRRHRERARDLAVRLEEQLHLVTTLAGSVDREWLRRWAEAPEDAEPNPYAEQMRAAARLVLEEIER